MDLRGLSSVHLDLGGAMGMGLVSVFPLGVCVGRSTVLKFDQEGPV